MQSCNIPKLSYCVAVTTNDKPIMGRNYTTGKKRVTNVTGLKVK